LLVRSLAFMVDDKHRTHVALAGCCEDAALDYCRPRVFLDPAQGQADHALHLALGTVLQRCIDYRISTACLYGKQEGHILAVEYLEETPLLLGRPGMGLKLNTFYRRKHERDAGHLDIRKGPLGFW